MLNLDWVRRLIQMVDESEIDTVEISRFGTRVVVSKSPPAAAPLVVSPSDASVETTSPPRAAPEAPPPQPEEAGAEAETDEPASVELHDVVSPMVGTFYRAPAPDAPPYVEVGDQVKQGQTLCILEAMKLMNELESELSGSVREIAVQNGDPVEYGQVLFRIEPGGG